MIPTPNTKELRIAISITMVDINYVREYWASTRFKAHLRVDFWRKPHGEDLFFRPRKRAKPRTKSKLLLISLLYHMNNDYIYIIYIYIYICGTSALRLQRFAEAAFVIWLTVLLSTKTHTICVYMIYIYTHVYTHIGSVFWFLVPKIWLQKVRLPCWLKSGNALPTACRMRRLAHGGLLEVTTFQISVGF